MNKILNDSFIGKILKTFLEGFIASLIIGISTIENYSDINIIKTIMIGAVAMGISAVLNLFQDYLNGKSNT